MGGRASRRWPCALVGAALLVAGCSGSHAAAPATPRTTTTVPTTVSTGSPPAPTTTTAPVAKAAPPAEATAPAPRPVTTAAKAVTARPVVALGDSISAGVPLGDYDITGSGGAWVVQPRPQPAARTASDRACQRSPDAWPSLLATARHRPVIDAACTGATLAGMAGEEAGQPPQLDQVTPAAGVVTLSIGANDVDLLGALARCYLTVDTCDAPDATTRFTASLDRFRSRLDATLADLVRRAAPDAALLVSTYYDTVPTEAQMAGGCAETSLAGGAVRLDSAEAAWVRDALHQLNGVIRAAVGANGRITLVDIEQAFAGHGLCDAEPWMFGPSILLQSGQTTNPAPLHPTRAGQEAIARAAAAALGAT